MSDVSDQRRYYERMMDEIATEHRQQIDQLKAENAKLRELAHILVHCLRDVSCDTCPLNGNPYDVCHEWAACDTLHELLGELGIGI